MEHKIIVVTIILLLISVSKGVSQDPNNTRSNKCPSLPDPRDAEMSCLETNTKKTCTAECIPGKAFHKTKNRMTLHCTGGQWRPTDRFPECESRGTCRLKLVGTGKYVCKPNHFKRNIRCQITCERRNHGIFTCEPNRGTWDRRLPRCVKKLGQNNERSNNCSSLPDPRDAEMSCLETNTKKTCTAECIPGKTFHKKRTRMTLYCTGGQWRPREKFPDCQSRGTCKLKIVADGKYYCKPNHFKRNIRCQITCGQRNQGFFTCEPNAGKWDRRLPKCVKKIGDETWQKAPWQKAPWQKAPWQKAPWQKEPWQTEPWQKAPWQKAPWQNEP